VLVKDKMRSQRWYSHSMKLGRKMKDGWWEGTYLLEEKERKVMIMRELDFCYALGSQHTSIKRAGNCHFLHQNLICLKQVYDVHSLSSYDD